LLRFLWAGISWLGPWARGYRLGRAFGSLMMMTLAIVTMSVTRCMEARDPVVGQATDVGRVVRIVAPEGYTTAWGSVVIDRGDTLTFFIPHPPPTTGDNVPLRVTEHRSGKREYSFDTLAWLENGPIHR